jgi:glycosyltransferase involved in cell wall biosynthesis
VVLLQLGHHDLADHHPDVVGQQVFHRCSPAPNGGRGWNLILVRELKIMKLAVCFTNFGPYHVARLRALAECLGRQGDRLIAYEVACNELRYPWSRGARDEPFEWITLFPQDDLETLDPDACRQALVEALDGALPDALGIVGYARPESMAAARWAQRRGRPAILMSESQAIDRPRVWWKELIKKRRVRQFGAALVGGPEHRDYLAQLGMPAERIVLGYNAVDNDYFATSARLWRESQESGGGRPAAPYFLAVCRFVPEKNLLRLIEAFARYRRECAGNPAWDLVLCGDGPARAEIERACAESGCGQAIQRPGFLPVDELPRWYSFAGALVLPSLSEPWGLVVNEAAASGVPLLVSRCAGCASTLVPEPEGTTGARFDPRDVTDLTAKLTWMAACTDLERRAMGRRAALTVACWGPDRFAHGVLNALDLARGIRIREAFSEFAVSSSRR